MHFLILTLLLNSQSVTAQANLTVLKKSEFLQKAPTLLKDTANELTEAGGAGNFFVVQQKVSTPDLDTGKLVEEIQEAYFIEVTKLPNVSIKNARTVSFADPQLLNTLENFKQGKGFAILMSNVKFPDTPIPAYARVLGLLPTKSEQFYEGILKKFQKCQMILTPAATQQTVIHEAEHLGQCQENSPFRAFQKNVEAKGIAAAISLPLLNSIAELLAHQKSNQFIQTQIEKNESSWSSEFDQNFHSKDDSDLRLQPAIQHTDTQFLTKELKNNGEKKLEMYASALKKLFSIPSVQAKKCDIVQDFAKVFSKEENFLFLSAIQEKNLEENCQK